MADDLTKAKDWIYVFCTVIQTFAAVVASIVVFWWDRRRRNKDRKEAKRKEDEEKQKADAEKIIAILSEKYDGAVEKFRVLKEHVDVLKNKKIVTGPLPTDTFTEFDFLLYMCHGDNWHKFDVMTFPLLQSKRVGYGRKEVMQAVTEIMAVFKDFAFQLSTIHRACPDSIKSEFSTEIKEMGKIIEPFVTKTRQKLIKKVLKYLDSTDSVSVPVQEGQSRCHGCMQCCCFPYTRVRSILRNCGTEDAGTVSHTTTSTTGNRRAETQSLVNADNFEMLEPPHATYPGHDVMQRAIPYIEHFRYENGKMSCNIECIYSCIKNLETLIMKGVPDGKKEEIQTHIRNLWPPQPSESDQLTQSDLLHLIRMVMFKLLDNSRSNFFGVGLGRFVENVKAIVNSPENLNEEVVNRRCKRAMDDLQVHIQNLQNDHQSLLKDQRTSLFLKDHAEGLRRFMMMMLRNAAPPEDEQSRNVEQAKQNISECLQQVENEGLLEDEMALFLLEYYAGGLKTFTQWMLDMHCRNTLGNMDASTEDIQNS